MKDYFSWMYCGTEIQDQLPNVWIGVTAENQEMFNKRVPVLLQIDAAIHFVSIEPMLEAINMTIETEDYIFNTLSGHETCKDEFKILTASGDPLFYETIDWVICGGETGPNSRKLNAAWVESLRDQCIANRVPFFFKSWGDWKCVYKIKCGNTIEHIGFVWEKVGKKHTGCEIGDQIYQQYPGDYNMSIFNIIYKH
jgi:protein gp37